MRSITQWTAILRNYTLSFESIQEYMKANQGFELAKKLVSDGDVRGFVLEDEKNNVASVSVWVHAHMNNTRWYYSTLKFSHQSVLEHSCTCEARDLPHMRKHVGALMCGLLALKEDYSTLTVAPKEFRRSNMQRFEGMSDSVRKAVGADLTWARLLDDLTTDPEKKREGVAHNDKFQSVPKNLQKKKEERQPCYS